MTVNLIHEKKNAERLVTKQNFKRVLSPKFSWLLLLDFLDVDKIWYTTCTVQFGLKIGKMAGYALTGILIDTIYLQVVASKAILGKLQ